MSDSSMLNQKKVDELSRLRDKAIRESNDVRYAVPRFDLASRKDKKHGIETKRIEWQDISFDDMKVIVVNNSYRDIPIMNAAILLNELDFPYSKNVIVIELEQVEEYERGREQVDWTTKNVTYEYQQPCAAEFALALAEYGDVLFDIRDELFPFKYVEGTTRWDYHWEYDGLRPYKPHVMDVRDKFISVLSQYWYGSFISGYNNLRSSSGGNLSLERASNLATALSLGQIEFDTDTLKKVKAPSWQREAIQHVRFSDNSMPEGLENLDEEIDKVEALLAFWEKAADYYRFSIRLDRDELDDVERLTQLCHRCGEMIGVDIYLDTYAAGVPAEDILV